MSSKRGTFRDLKVLQLLQSREYYPDALAVIDPGDEAAAAKLWAIYVAEAEKYDKGLVESWKSDMDGMLIFVSIFWTILISER
jgi:hypothetical protein